MVQAAVAAVVAGRLAERLTSAARAEITVVAGEGVPVKVPAAHQAARRDREGDFQHQRLGPRFGGVVRGTPAFGFRGISGPGARHLSEGEELWRARTGHRHSRSSGK